MKKSILTFALFSLVVLTSFTTLTSPSETGDDDPGNGTPTTTTDDASRRDTGGQHQGGSDKKDIIQTVVPFAPQYPNQEIPSRKKSDF